MINIELIQQTAERLMAKAAIQIPDDYLAGLQHAANYEDGGLSSFVLEAMLENYEAAKEDSRAIGLVVYVDAGADYRLNHAIAKHGSEPVLSRSSKNQRVIFFKVSCLEKFVLQLAFAVSVS